jgi:acetate kinase
MHALEESQSDQAQLAIDLFCHRAACEISALLPSIGGLDALVFTAGIGENSARARASICARLIWLGLDLDPARNAAGQGMISAPKSRVAALVLPTNEELPIARALRALVPAR